MGSDTPASNSEETSLLIRDAGTGDLGAVRILLERYRGRLRRMIALRLDTRLLPRIDASDIVQEALTDAAQKMVDYARNQPLPFYPWLHRLAAERLAQAHRRHRLAEVRSVDREEAVIVTWPDHSSRLLVDRLASSDSGPSQALLRAERNDLLYRAIGELAEHDREVLLMRYIEELNFREIAAILGIGEGAAKMRHLRALQRIRALMDGDDSGSSQ